MNKKKNQTSIDLDAIMTTYLTLDAGIAEGKNEVSLHIRNYEI